MADIGTEIVGALGTAAGGSIDPVGAVAKLGDDIVNAIWPSPEAKATAEAQIAQTQIDAYVKKAQADMAPLLAQLDIDKQEAANPSWFVAGARPALLWVCVIALAIYYWPGFLLGIIFWTVQCWHAGALTPLPALGIDQLLGLLGPMLGISTLRTVDKAIGTDTKTIGGTTPVGVLKAVASAVTKRKGS